ncbi:MAG: DUF1850 domain-containing protein [Thermovirgaceae bacterium]
MALKKRLILPGFFFAIAGIVFLLTPVTVLEIENTDARRCIYRQPVRAGYNFATFIRHSVHLTPVYEYYTIDKAGRIILTGTRLQDLGWGVPSTFSEKSRFEEDFLVIEGMNKPIRFIPFRVSHITGPRLLLDGGDRVVELSSVTEDMDRLDIRTRRDPRWKQLIRGETDEFPKQE